MTVLELAEAVRRTWETIAPDTESFLESEEQAVCTCLDYVTSYGGVTEADLEAYYAANPGSATTAVVAELARKRWNLT